MNTEHNEEQFLVISDTEISYHKTATEAVIACGYKPYNCAFVAKAAQALEPGDELSVTTHASVIRLTGKDTDYYG